MARNIIVELMTDGEDIATSIVRNENGAVAYFSSEEEADRFAEQEGIENYDIHDLDEIIASQEEEEDDGQ